MAAHMASLERQTGRTMREDVPVMPWPLSHVWEWFVGELSGRRSSGGFGVNPITHAEIEAWARLTNRTPTPREVRLLLRLDDAMVHALRPRRTK